MLQKNVKKFIKVNELLLPLESVVVGVSGGPDSLSLLYILNELRVDLGIRIVVAHLNHGLRAKKSNSDEDFVKQTAFLLRFDFESKLKRWPAKMKKLPSEERLRNIRRDFLFSVAKKHKIRKIALGHTLDDQAETVLMRLVRGSGLHGLAAMLPKRNMGPFVIIRPLLGVSRSEIEAYLRQMKIKPRIDKSNFNKKYLRNKLRHKVLKDLKFINPNIRKSLARFAQQAAIDYDYIAKQANRFIKQPHSGCIAIKLSIFLRLHLSLQRMVIRSALEKLSGSLRSFTNMHWEEVQDLISSRPSGSVVDVTKGIKIVKSAGEIRIYSGRIMTKAK